MLNPSVPKSARKVISLPPLVPLPYSLDPSESTPLTELVRNVSLSSSPDQEDCIAAIKFWGSCISFCRRSPSDDDSSWSWSHINSLPFAFKASSLIYSNTASIFYITPSTAVRSDHSRNFEQYEHKDKHGFPLVAYFMQLGPFEPPGKLSDSELKLLLGCSGGDSRFLVETPSGDIFTIMRYMQTHDIDKGAESYVADIGDFCIFFGKNEPFCIPASVYPGLKPNSIYFTEKTHVSVYDIATHNIDQLPNQEHLLTPFWLPPILHYQIRRGGIRLLTTSSSLSPAPYMLLSMDGIRRLSKRYKLANFNYYDPINQKRVTMAEQRIPESIYLSSNIGSSRGWMIRMNEEDLTVRNVSLSSSPDNPDQECILAVKFWGSFVSYCTIRDGQWRHELSLSSRASKSFVFYSNNDATFYLTPPIDTFFRKDGRNMPEPSFPCLTYYRQFGPLKHPKMGEYEFELLRRCTRSKQLVESPSGDLFIIVKYALQTSKGKPVFPGETRDLDRSEVKTGTRWFMLYMRHPTTRVESYVQDIGDLCIL
ncbi:unnamed protein product, partial [Arabidopsis lyrata]